MTKTMENYWDDVEDAAQEAILIAWDTCHKIYLAMDAEQAEWFRENYAPDIYEGTPDEMVKKLHEWFDQSCGLRFINAVETNHADPNAGYTALIPQGAGDEDWWGQWDDLPEYDD